MKATIILSVIGVLGFSEDGQVVDKILFKKNAKLIAEKLNLVDSKKTIEETIVLARRLQKKGYDAFVFENAAAQQTAMKQLKIDANIAQPSPHGENLRRNLEKFAFDLGFIKDAEKLRALIRGVAIELTRLKVKKAGEKKDLLVAQAILSIDDLDKTANLFMGRIREWFGLHFPELDRMIDKHETYARLISNLGDRKNFTEDNLKNEGLPRDKATSIAECAGNSMGAQLTGTDIEKIQDLCDQTLKLYSLRQDLQGYADSTIGEVAPNVQALIGSMLTARLIALAGGLVSLAKMPASTIQVLGAEKALFRALKTGSRPPKHGIIYQDMSIHDSKRWQRGKISRALAGKIAIAARTDAFSNRYIGDVLKADLEKRVNEIKEKYAKPPPREERRRRRRKSGPRR